MARRTLAEEPRLCERGFYRHWRSAMIRHSDLDPNAHVTNTVFAVWLDDGRYALLRDVLFPLLGPTETVALVSVTIDYAAEIGFDDAPEVGTVVLRCGKSSITIGQGLFAAGRCAATAHSTTVVLDRVTRRGRTLNDAERDALLRV